MPSFERFPNPYFLHGPVVPDLSYMSGIPIMSPGEPLDETSLLDFEWDVFEVSYTRELLLPQPRWNFHHRWTTIEGDIQIIDVHIL
jgi:hypothetical protein